MSDLTPSSSSPNRALEGILQQMDRVRAMARVLVKDASAACPTMMDARADGVTAPITLRMPERKLALVGQVIDASGAPLKGMEVYVVNGTQLGPNSFAWFEHWRVGADWLDPFKTDSRGVFRVPHVLDRPYRLRVIDPDTLFVHDVKVVRVHEGLVRIQLPANRMLPEVRGVVLDHFGQPVPGARVSLSAETSVTTDQRRVAVTTDPVLTDPSGQFRLTDVPWRGIELRALHPEGIGASAATTPLHRGSASGRIQLQLDLECRLRLTLPGRLRDRRQRSRNWGPWRRLSGALRTGAPP